LLYFIGESIEVVVKAVIRLSLDRIGSQIADESGLRSIGPKLFYCGEIILHFGG